MEGRKGVWKEEREYGRKEGRMERRENGWKEVWKEGRENGRKEGRMERRENGRTDGSMEGMEERRKKGRTGFWTFSSSGVSNKHKNNTFVNLIFIDPCIAV